MLERGEKGAGRFGVHMAFRGNGREINRQHMPFRRTYFLNKKTSYS